jgi:hypothetical protein
MAGYNLDFLIMALQSAVANAQHAVRRQQEAALQQVIDIGDDGKPKYISWVCCLPSSDGGECSYEMMRMPFVSLRSNQVMVISELSVEFGCEIKKPLQQEVSNSSQLIVVPRRRTKKRAECAHRIRITLREPDGGEGDVIVDSVALKEIKDDRFLLSKYDLSQLLRKDSSRTKRFFRWKSPFVWFLISLLMAAITALIIRMDVVTLL